MATTATATTATATAKKQKTATSLSLASWEHVARATGVLNLGIGQPNRSLLPSEAIQRAANNLSKYDSFYVLQYGAPAGSTHYLDALASFLGEQPLGHSPSPTNLFATPGNSGGLALVTRALTAPGDSVLMEDPSYFLAHQVFRDHHLELISLPQRTDRAGTVDMDSLEATLASVASTGARMPKLLYCVPTGNNPKGETMGDGDRARLVRLCAEHGVVVVADDVYELLQYEMSAAPKPLRWHAAQQGAAGTVVSLGSWSKLFGPGLRLGWLEADEAMIAKCAADGETDSGSLTSPLVESIITNLVQSGDAATHVVELRAALAKRAALLAAAINDAQPPGTPPIVHAAPAGYFLWVDCRGVDAQALRDRCVAEHGVTFLPGNRCTLDGAAAPTHARVCYAFLDEDELVEAGRRLGRAIAASAGP